MAKLKVKVGDTICITGYKNDGKSRVVLVDTIKPGGLMICKCLIRSSVAKPLFRSYYAKHISKISPIKLD